MSTPELIQTIAGLAGKTITSATRMAPPGVDDKPFLRLQFTDGTEAYIRASYGGYTGNSDDEYPAFVTVASGDEIREMARLVASDKWGGTREFARYVDNQNACNQAASAFMGQVFSDVNEEDGTTSCWRLSELELEPTDNPPGGCVVARFSREKCTQGTDQLWSCLHKLFFRPGCHWREVFA